MCDTVREYIRKAIEHLGGYREVAKICGVSDPCSYAWIRKGRIPISHAILLEKSSNGKFKRQKFCPELFK